MNSFEYPQNQKSYSELPGGTACRRVQHSTSTLGGKKKKVTNCERVKSAGGFKFFVPLFRQQTPELLKFLGYRE